MDDRRRTNVKELSAQQRMIELLRQRYNLRVHPEMGDYLLRKLQSRSTSGSIPVMGGDARTGVAIRQLLMAADLQAAVEPLQM
jgi:hypothetical protein